MASERVRIVLTMPPEAVRLMADKSDQDIIDWCVPPMWRMYAAVERATPSPPPAEGAPPHVSDVAVDLLGDDAWRAAHPADAKDDDDLPCSCPSPDCAVLAMERADAKPRGEARYGAQPEGRCTRCGENYLHYTHHRRSEPSFHPFVPPAQACERCGGGFWRYHCPACKGTGKPEAREGESR